MMTCIWGFSPDVVGRKRQKERLLARQLDWTPELLAARLLGVSKVLYRKEKTSHKGGKLAN